MVDAVAVPALRGPAATAKVLAALDVLSEGRLIVGVGPGSSARDYALIGVPFEERWKRLDESIRVMRSFWGEAEPTFVGTFYSSAGMRLAPSPAQRPGPPIWIGSWGSPAGLRRVAGLADGWLASGYNTTPELFGGAWRSVLQQLADAGRDPSGFPNGIATMWCYVSNDVARAETMLTEVLSPMLNRSAVELRAVLPIGTPEDCIARLLPYRAAGAQRIFLWPLADEREQLERFRRDVIPYVE